MTNTRPRPKSPPAPVKRVRGRPPSTELRERLIGLAAAEFKRHGFKGTSLEHIAQVAGASKVTLYRLFGTKEYLFALVGMSRPDDLRDDISPLLNIEERPDRVLLAVAHAMYRRVNLPETVAYVRLAIAEMQDFPDVTREILDREYAYLASLMDYFSALDQRGILKFDDARIAARQFIILSCEGIQFLIAPRRTREYRERWLQSVVDLFLRGYGYAAAETAADRHKPRPAKPGNR